jgi:aminoglycoside phosphotransferase (APT) family kinase protein
MTPSSSLPDEAMAARIAREVVGQPPREVQRFTTGAHHYVYDVSFDEHAPVVVRIAAPAHRDAMIGAATMSRRLRPRGVPLPETLAEGLDAPCPFMVLERLAGEDLGRVVGALAPAALDRIARGVAAAQAIVAREPRADRYGYATDAAAAPHLRWSQVLDDNMTRARTQIAAAGLFDEAPVDRMCALIDAHRAALDAQPAVAFLHDATTKNVIVTRDGTLSGIVDVDELCFGDPRYVVALTSASLALRGRSQHYVEALLAHGGHRDDALFRLYVASFLVDFMGEHGHAFNGNATASTVENRARVIAALERALRRLDEA